MYKEQFGSIRTPDILIVSKTQLKVIFENDCK